MSGARELAGEFVGGARHGSSGAMVIIGDVLYSYNMPIAKRVAGEFVVTTRKYSFTTSKHTSAIRDAVKNAAYELREEDLGAPLDGKRRKKRKRKSRRN